MPEKAIRPRAFEVAVNQRLFKVSVTELTARGAAPAITGIPSGTASDYLADHVGLYEPHRGKSGEISVEARTLPASGNAAVTVVRAPMHGLVKELLISEGDIVENGQRLLIFEAMKMESDVVATSGGRVVSIKVKTGDTVQASSVLVVMGDRGETCE